jgi:hypothetical protein
MMAKLQDQLPTPRELDSREGAIVTWEESLTAFARTLREASTGHDSSRAHRGAAQHDYLAQVRDSNS